jgi:hypothetical protein
MTETTRILRRGPAKTERVVNSQLLGELEKVLPSPTSTGKNLYHYSTQAGLLGIANDQALWMTDIRHLNDSTEFEYAMSLVRGKIDTKLKEQKNLNYREFLGSMANLLNVFEAYTKYVACFSEDGDSLSQWRGYTDNGTGFSIAWKDTILNSLAGKQFHRLVKCVYDPEEHSKIIERLFAAIESKFEPDWVAPEHNGLFFFLLFQVAAAMKHPKFKDEQEWRIVSIDARTPEVIKFRPGRSRLIPYIEFSLETEDEYLGISEIVVGPNPHMLLSIDSTRQFARQHKLGKHISINNIIPSGVPYRAW